MEVDDSEWHGELEKIQTDFPQDFVCPKANHMLTHVDFDPHGQAGQRVAPRHASQVTARSSCISTPPTFKARTAFRSSSSCIGRRRPARTTRSRRRMRPISRPSSEAERAAYQKAYVETVKERVTIASKIQTRNADELRDEERIVVYRKLIQDMLLSGVDMPDDRTRHVMAELLNSIFDIDKMLYFVAPEWWRPRLHRSRQQVQPTPPRPTFDIGGLANIETSVMQRGLVKRVLTANASVPSGVMSASTVGWGGVDDAQRDNYSITEDSEPAKLGSSLGWLLQLDGDNMRNAFLNAPWVKAVIPIRPGKEQAAINWLKGVEGMNGITDDVIYHSSNPDEKDVNGEPLEGQKLIDVLMDLAEKDQTQVREGIETGKYPKQDEVSDPALVDEENTVTATPIDRVYEHGFFPLEDSFRFNVGEELRDLRSVDRDPADGPDRAGGSEIRSEDGQAGVIGEVSSIAAIPVISGIVPISAVPQVVRPVYDRWRIPGGGSAAIRSAAVPSGGVLARRGSAAKDAGITDPAVIADIIFFLLHPERMSAGVGKRIAKDEPDFSKLRAEWEHNLIIAERILDALGDAERVSAGTREPQVRRVHRQAHHRQGHDVHPWKKLGRHRRSPCTEMDERIPRCARELRAHAGDHRVAPRGGYALYRQLAFRATGGAHSRRRGPDRRGPDRAVVGGSPEGEGHRRRHNPGHHRQASDPQSLQG